MILGVESSCDDTALSLFDPTQGVYGNWVHSQTKTHIKYGGVVPELGSRKHLENFVPLANSIHNKHPDAPIAKIAVTYGPGLSACLAMGVSFASALAMSLNVPLVGVNHLRAHLYSPFISLYEKDPVNFDASFQNLLPHLGLLVSGGNTLLVKIDTDRSLRIISQTVDDAAGEALDKGAKLLGLTYPGGPEIELKAKLGNPLAFNFPRAIKAKNDLRFSFSGLKTSLRYTLEGMPEDEFSQKLPDLCASYQHAVVEQLSHKVKHALNQRTYNSFSISGGVSNNKALQQSLGIVSESTKTPLILTRPEHTGDNAAMIAFASHIDSQGCLPSNNRALKIAPALSIA